MNKTAAEIIAGVIPHKMTRNRWRGILRYGLGKAFRLKRDIRHNRTRPKHRLAICAIAKNEGQYLREWIDYHRSMGVDKFYFYDNESADATQQILEPYIKSGLVEYIPFPGYRMQLAAYDDCLYRHRYDCLWIAFIDIDEFIVPVAYPSIPDFLEAVATDAPAVEINWLVYGSNGQVEKSEQPVMERFTRHSVFDHPLNRHVKSIVNPRKVFTMTGCHEATRITGKAVDSHGTPITHNFKERTPQHDVIRINHYAVKSRQEFIEKQGRGRASGTQRTVPDEYFERYDLNDISD